MVLLFLVMNVLSFALMGWDKRCAIRGKRRIPERTLFLVTACFGGLGGVLGMQFFRHKTRHWYFKVFFPLLMIVQLAILLALFGVRIPLSLANSGPV